MTRHIDSTGTCLCGAVRFRARGEMQWFGLCHCQRCRKASGALAAADIGLPADALTWLAGEEHIHASGSPGPAPRPFCGICGSNLPHASQEYGLAVVQAGLLDGDPGIRPDAHIFTASMPAWDRVSDGLPCHPAYPADLDAPALTDLDDRVLPSGTQGGSCLCGQVRYTWSGNPLGMRHCHCGRCRRARAAAHATNLFVPADGFHWAQGAEAVVEFALPGAERFGQAFCGTCGGAVPRRITGHPLMNVPAGSLDCDPGVRPTEHIFVASKAAWHQITDTLPKHPGAAP